MQVGESTLRRKRSSRQPSLKSDHAPVGEAEFDASEGSVRSHDPARSPHVRLLDHVAIEGPDFPRSAYQGWKASLPESCEHEAIIKLKERHSGQKTQIDEGSDYVFFHLEDFSIYRPHSGFRGSELLPLDALNNERACEELRVDGTLLLGDAAYYIQNRPFRTLTIDGYGDRSVLDLSGRICIQTERAHRADVWYTLGQPSKDYARYYNPFLWLAMFAKQFVDYLLEESHITLDHFCSNFTQWAADRHWQNETFLRWFAQGPVNGFRSTVAANFGFLWKECYSVDAVLTGPQRHPVWAEVDPFRFGAIPQQPVRKLTTTVTPFVYRCFQHMPFANILQLTDFSPQSVAPAARQRKQRLGLVTSAITEREVSAIKSVRSETAVLTSRVQPGDVVCIERDVDSKWRTDAKVWYAYVQEIRETTARGLALDVIWLYAPHDTTIGSAYYPYPYELFLSDHCECGKDAIDVNLVSGKIEVEWFVQDPSKTRGWFVRQTFHTIAEYDNYDFVRLSAEDFTCSCRGYQESDGEYAAGDCVLILDKTTHRLEPTQILRVDSLTSVATLRKFARAEMVNKAARPNHIVETEDRVSVKVKNIVRRCQVRTFSNLLLSRGRIPVPYNRDGVGDHFYLIESDLSSIRHGAINCGWDPTTSNNARLRGLGIFCGGGNFDRGLEEGGAIEFHYAVDLAEHALHTYRANASNAATQYFSGSVNDYLALALGGAERNSIAKVDDVDFISAGSPCPGFSLLTNTKTSDRARQQASMVASVLAFADAYSPEYLVLENVPSIANNTDPKVNVFGQVIATFVAMGYQTQQICMQSCNHGSCQQRERLFVIATAPIRQTPTPPPHTHGLSPQLKRRGRRSVGRMANGLPYGSRRDDWTPFQHVSAHAATSDLPRIGNGQVMLCPRFPDHRIRARLSAQERERIEVVPIVPEGLGLALAHKMGLLAPGEVQEYAIKRMQNKWKRVPKSYSRIRGSDLMPTITTCLVPQCCKSGRVLHWQEHRPITLMESRRGQGFPDHEVLVGSLAQQSMIIGNSVERHVAVALGCALRQSVERGYLPHGRKMNATRAVMVDNSSHASLSLRETMIKTVVRTKLEVETIELCSDSEVD